MCWWVWLYVLVGVVVCVGGSGYYQLCVADCAVETTMLSIACNQEGCLCWRNAREDVLFSLQPVP